MRAPEIKFVLNSKTLVKLNDEDNITLTFKVKTDVEELYTVTKPKHVEYEDSVVNITDNESLIKAVIDVLAIELSNPSLVMDADEALMDADDLFQFGVCFGKKTWILRPRSVEQNFSGYYGEYDTQDEFACTIFPELKPR